MAVAWSRPANRLVTRHLRGSVALGWTAVAALCISVFAVGGNTGMLMAVASAPFVGLAVWRTGPGRDDDDPEPEPDDEPPAPDAVARRGVRLPAPPRRRPSGHRPARTPSRPRVPQR